MKTFVLIVLTLCMTHVEMSRKLFTERSHRHKWRRDLGAGRSIRQILRKNLSHRNGRLAESKSSSRVARSIIIKDYGSGHTEYSMGTNSAGVDHGFGSGFSSGDGSGSFFMSAWLNDGIQTEEESHTMNSNEKTVSYSDDNTKTRQVSSNLNFVLKPKIEPIKTKSGIISVLTQPARKKRSVAQWFVGSGDTAGSGSSSDEHILLSGSDESSGTGTVEEVSLNPHAVQIEYAQGQREQEALSAGSGSERGSGIVYVLYLTKGKPSASEIDTVPGEQITYSGSYAQGQREQGALSAGSGRENGSGIVYVLKLSKGKPSASEIDTVPVNQ